jgi:hypothetical protein
LAAYTTRMSADCGRLPKSRTTSGIRATEGIGRRNSMVEAVIALSSGALPITRPAATPISMARIRPIAQPRSVCPTAIQKSPSCTSRPSEEAIEVAGGRYRGSTAPLRGRISSIATTHSSPRTPRPTLAADGAWVPWRR